MQTRLLKALRGLRSSLPTRRQSALLTTISAVCVVAPLFTLIGLQHKADQLISDPTSPEQELLNGRYRALEEQQNTAIAIALVTTSIGLLSTLATFYLLRRLHSELLNRETQLQDNNALLKAIEGSVTDSLFTLDSQGQIETFNPAALRMFGYDSSEIVGKTLNLLLDEATTNESNLEVSEEAIDVQRSQKGVAHRKLGASFPVELSIGQVAAHRRRIAIVRDITQQAQLEAELQSRLKELAEITANLTQARIELQHMYMTCHDLKSPLQAIVHLSKWIEADLTERVRADTQNQIDLMQERVQRMEGLVNSILETAPPKNEVQV